MNQKQIDPKKADALINVLSKKLNVPASTLKQQFGEGRFDAAINAMGKSETQKFNTIVNNPGLMEKFISTPQAQALYKKLTGEK